MAEAYAAGGPDADGVAPYSGNGSREVRPWAFMTSATRVRAAHSINVGKGATIFAASWGRRNYKARVLIFLLKSLGSVGILLSFGTIAAIRGQRPGWNSDPQKRAEAMIAYNNQSAAPYAFCLLGGVALIVVSAVLLNHYEH